MVITSYIGMMRHTRRPSAIPTLKLHVLNTNQLKVVDLTMNKYICDNIPIERFDLDIRIENPESAFVAENWIRFVATKSSLRELTLKIILIGASFTLPYEILTVAKNLTKLKVSGSRGRHSVWMIHPPNPIISCVSLQELLLGGVRISQEFLDRIFLSCRWLVKLELVYCSLDSIKVINRPCLNELRIYVDEVDETALEVSHVQNLRMFRCQLPRPVKVGLISLGSNVTELLLGGLVEEGASLNMFTSGLPFLENLTLEMGRWTLGYFHFTCATLKRLSLQKCTNAFIDVQVYAPKLTFFMFGGCTMPRFLFPVPTILEETTFRLTLDMTLDASFFLKMREALTLSSGKCDISITIKNNEPPSHIDIDDLRTRLVFPPANNVQLLEFHTVKDECMWERSPFFDAFFEICHPNQVLAKPDEHFRKTNHFCKLMLRELLEKKKKKSISRDYWHRCLKHVQIRHNEKWEKLKESHKSFLDEPPPVDIDFRLNWR